MVNFCSFNIKVKEGNANCMASVGVNAFFKFYLLLSYFNVFLTLFVFLTRITFTAVKVFPLRYDLGPENCLVLGNNSALVLTSSHETIVVPLGDFES